MDEATRLQYLHAMGIDVWVPRHRTAAMGVNEDNEPQPIPADTESPETAAQILEPLNIDETQAVCVEKYAAAPPPPPDPPTSEPAISPTAPGSRRDENDWTTLRQAVAACHACELCQTRTQTVFGVGNRHADWMLIGEAPGQDEDLQGEPFVGKAGQLLTEMLRAMGLKREQVYIANILKCRPPHNRDPEPAEVAACNRFLQQQIAMVRPKLILAVGRIAAQNLLESKQSLSRLRGMVHRFDNIPVIAIYHPAYLLRSLSEKAKAWEDLQFALSVFAELEK